MKRIAIYQTWFALFVFCFVIEASASSLCELMFLNESNEISDLRQEMKRVITRAARLREPLMFSSLSQLRVELQSVQLSATTRMHENGKILLRSRQPLGVSLQGAAELLRPISELSAPTETPKNAAGRSLRPAELQTLLMKVSEKGKAIKLEQGNLDEIENELRRNLRLTQNLIRRVRFKIQELTTLEAWILRTHEKKQLITLNSFLAELRGQKYILENQMQFLESFYPRFDQALESVVQASMQIRNFFATLWPMTQNRLWAQKIPVTNFVGATLTLEDHEKAFDRQFVVGDRLIVVRENEDRFLKSVVPLEMYIGTYAERWSDQGKGNGYHVEPVISFEGFKYEPKEERKSFGIRWRKQRTVVTPKSFVLSRNLNSVEEMRSWRSRTIESVFYSFLADSRMNIDGHSLGETLEVDLNRIFSLQSGKKLALSLHYDLDRTFGSEIDVHKSHSDSILYHIKNLKDMGGRAFVRILGTHPVDNSVLVAYWTANPAFGEVTPLKLRLIKREALALLKTFDEHFFYWPELESLQLNPQALFTKPERM